MKTLIVFDTRKGTTRKIAEELAEVLGDGSQTFELGKGGYAPIDRYDAVILGGPVYARSWSRRAACFAKDNADVIGNKRFAAFSSGFRLDQAPKILRAALPPQLSDNAVALAGVGGAYDLSRMNPMERFMLRVAAGVTSDGSSISKRAILDIAGKIQNGR